MNQLLASSSSCQSPESQSSPAGELLQDAPFDAQSLPRTFGRYRLIRILGVGGMGTVYLADDQILRRKVAVKFPNRGGGKRFMNRFVAEARSAARIRHPGVCSLFDIGCESGRAYLTMEYVAGQPLDRYVSPEKPIAPIAAARLVLRIAAAVHAAHQQGVIHRDLKPANILMRDGREPVVTDFGLAHRNELSAKQALEPKVLGSPAYMSPEQVRGQLRDVGPATDVYGLGAVLFELLTGQRPFRGTITSIYSQVLTKAPPAPSQIRAGIDPRLDAICRRALAKRPEDRYANMIELARALQAYLQTPAPSVRKVVPVRNKTAAPVASFAPITACTPAQSAFSQQAAEIDALSREDAGVRAAIRHCVNRARWRLSQHAAPVSAIAAIILMVCVAGWGYGQMNASGNAAEATAEVDQDVSDATTTVVLPRRPNLRPLVHSPEASESPVELVAWR